MATSLLSEASIANTADVLRPIACVESCAASQLLPPVPQWLVGDVRRKVANLPQFLVSEVHLFFSAGAFQVAQSCFVRNTAQLVFRKAEQVRGLSPVLQILGHHYRSRPPLICSIALASISTSGHTAF